MIRIFLILIVFALIVLFITRLQGDAYKRFMVNAGEVMGKIKKKETRIHRSDKPQMREHYLLYSYTVAGTTYHGEEKVEYDDLWQDARDGMELRVYYDKSNPAKSYPAALIDRRLKIAEKM